MTPAKKANKTGFIIPSSSLRRFEDILQKLDIFVREQNQASEKEGQKYKKQKEKKQYLAPGYFPRIRLQPKNQAQNQKGNDKCHENSPKNHL